MLQPERKTNNHKYVRGFDYSVKLRTSAAAENFERVPKTLLIDTWRHMSARLNNGMCNSIPAKIVKTYRCSQISRKPTVQPMMKFSQVILKSESRSEPKLKKKSKKKNICDRFWVVFEVGKISRFLCLRKIFFTDFYFNLHECLNRDNIWFPKFWGGFIQHGEDFEKNVIKSTSAQSLLGIRSLILAIY